MLISAPEPVQVGSTVITQKSLYLALFVIGASRLPHIQVAQLTGRAALVVDCLTRVDVLLACRQ
jgi:hypothetical protein